MLFMKIRALQQFFMAGVPSFSKDEVRDVTEELGMILVERELAEKVEEKKSVEPPNQSAKTDNQSKKTK